MKYYNNNKIEILQKKIATKNDCNLIFKLVMEIAFYLLNLHKFIS